MPALTTDPTAILHHWQTTDPSFARALQSGVAPAQALAKLGVRLFTKQRIAESLSALRAADALSPNDPELLSNLAVVQENAGLTTQAINSLERSLALLHAQPDSWLLLGNLKQKTANLPGAHTAYQAAVTLDPRSPIAWQSLALNQQAQRQLLPAIESLLQCMRLGQITAPLLSILGQLFYETGQFDKCRDSYAAAVEVDPQHTVSRQMLRELEFTCAALAGDSIESALQSYDSSRTAHPVPGDKSTHDLLQTTFALLSAHGHPLAAQRIAATRAALFPNSATAAYLLQASSGESSLPRSPDAYLVECFDEFADRFDHHLVTTLGYDIPQKLAAALLSHLPPNERFAILDAGCGTGLCAPHLRPIASTLTGVDLSPKMLARAADRHLYDHLHCLELTSFLQSAPQSFDIILAADVLIYFGNLTPLAAAFAHALKPGGFLAISTERSPTPGHHILPSGRFAHHPDYIAATFAAHFTPLLSQDTTVRLEISKPVPGNLYIFRRR